MRFNIRDCISWNLSGSQRRRDHIGLAVYTRCKIPNFQRAIIVDRRAPNHRVDAVAIADERIDALLLAKEIEDGAVPDLSSLPVDKRYDRMKKIYKDRTGTKPEPPDFETGLKDGSIPAPVDGSGEDAEELDGSDARKYLETDWMREELRPSFMPTDAELDELGMARARAVRDALLADGTVAPERVFTNTDLAVSAHEDLARLELQIK